MNKEQAEEIIAGAFAAATDEQHVNQLEWLLNDMPVLGGEIAAEEWHMDGIP